MAACCGSTLALMDAGVPIKEVVAGISIGLITDKKDKSKYVLLTDIAYQEDAQGDMDFKIAGTKNGITAIQMDIKLDGISQKIVEETLEKARLARLSILENILATIPIAREKISKYAPTVILVKIDPAKIGEVIGSGGKTINKIIAATGCAIDINDEGTVTISGKVSRILPFGAMVEILPGKEGLVNISQLAPHRVNRVEDVVKIGQELKVRVIEIDDQGRVNLSARFDEDAPQPFSGQIGNGPRRDFAPRRFDRRHQRGPDRRRPPKRY